ncbi:hypothetical protein PFISCL1PPCAC_8178, partial [Pristionchus fissidentatus]
LGIATGVEGDTPLQTAEDRQKILDEKLKKKRDLQRRASEIDKAVYKLKRERSEIQSAILEMEVEIEEAHRDRRVNGEELIQSAILEMEVEIEEAHRDRRVNGEELENEVLLHIFSRMKLRDRVCARVNKRMYGIEQLAEPLVTLQKTSEQLFIKARNEAEVSMVWRDDYRYRNRTVVSERRGVSFDAETALAMAGRWAITRNIKALAYTDVHLLSSETQQKFFELLSTIRVDEYLFIIADRGLVTEGFDSRLEYRHLATFFERNLGIADAHVDALVPMTIDDLNHLQQLTSRMR